MFFGVKFEHCYARGDTPAAHMVHLSQTRRALIWSVLAVIVALLCLLGFRGYLSVDMLINFANLFYC